MTVQESIGIITEADRLRRIVRADRDVRQIVVSYPLTRGGSRHRGKGVRMRVSLLGTGGDATA